MLGPRAAVEGSFVSYKGLQGGFEELWVPRGGIGRGMRGFFSGMVRGVSMPDSAPEFLTFFYRA